MSNFVLVLDTNKQPLSPRHHAVARKLLKNANAAIFRRFPYTIILKRAVEVPNAEPITLKIDPGSKTMGIALVQGVKVLWGAELELRGQAIRKALQTRRAIRRNRRSRHTRYRKPRFLNRTRPAGWLAPSLLHRVQTTLTWVKRLCRLAPITGLSQELVRFDMQGMVNPEITGVEYQQGTLAGYETREYLLEKWQRKCAYCGAENTPLQIEHIQPKSGGGTDRISNLALACAPCNRRKGSQPLEVFLAGKPDVLKRLLAQAKAPLKEAAAVNATRWKLFESLKATGLPVAVTSGGRTKWNRTRLSLPKAHWVDAACVGDLNTLTIKILKPLCIRCVGHGTRQACRTDKYGFPRRHKTRRNIHFGFQTGDIVKALVTVGKKIGAYLGKVACRASGSFNVSTAAGVVEGIRYTHCTILHRKDGYSY